MNNINFTFHTVLLLTIIQKHIIFAANKNLLTITVINNHEVTIKSSEHLHLLTSLKLSNFSLDILKWSQILHFVQINQNNLHKNG